MSAFAHFADSTRTSPEVREVPLSAASRCSKTTLLDHLVGAQQDRSWQLDADRLRGLKIDHGLEFRRLLDRQIGGLGAAEYPGRIRAGAAVHRREIHAI